METIEINDDGGSKEVLKVTIQEVKTVEQTDVKFDGTLSDLSNETLPRLYAQRDAILAEIAKYEALVTKIQVELNKLPVREVVAEGVVK